MEKQIIPAVIAQDQDELMAILDKIGNHARLIQLDVMDGRFVPNRSLDFDFNIPAGKYIYEAHLMIQDPLTWLDQSGDMMQTIIAHFEVLDEPGNFIEAAKKKGKKAGLAINPETGLDSILPYLKDLDQVLIMTVHPGAYGSRFLSEMLVKIRTLRAKAPGLDIEVDGGISPDTIWFVCEAGANMFVSGSYLIKADNLGKNVEILWKSLRDEL
ncbi:MAG: ribulose-phosphate 3-epimerase [Candidatus Aminicenantes bacterium]|nr:ribulose-phosphate 3-epimerase [Candidatus Aminicenantes bacterium]